MTSLFLEPFSGISGDMLNGLLVDLGGDVTLLRSELEKLGIDGFHLHVDHIAKSAIWGTDFDVHLHHVEKDTGIEGDFDHKHHHDHEHGHSHADAPARSYADIHDLIAASQLSPFVKEKSLAVFLDIAKAEAAVHNMPVEQIHFHEIGAIDSIVDIVSFFILVESLGIDTVYSTPLTEGSGTISVAHGEMPVPVPAVIQLRKGITIPITQDFTVKTELITPTGLALLKALDPIFEPIPSHFAIQSVGYGFGKRDTGKFNALRGSLLKEDASHSTTNVHHTDDYIVEITTTIDDQTPEYMADNLNRFLDAGALDVYYRSIVMKKNRPGFELTLLIQNTQLEDFSTLLFKETSTIGFRYQQIDRKVMQRRFEHIDTEFGTVTVKINQYGSITKKTLEYEDCQRIAKKMQLPIQEVYNQLQKYIY